MSGILASLQFTSITLLLIGGFNWGITAIRSLISPEGLVQDMIEPFGLYELQIGVYFSIFLASIVYPVVIVLRACGVGTPSETENA